MIDIDRETLNDLLHVDVLTVTFTKKNGDTRVMKCTLREDLLPAVPEKEPGTNAKKINEEVMPVWDMDAKGFRSFRVDSITAIQSSPGKKAD